MHNTVSPKFWPHPWIITLTDPTLVSVLSPGVAAAATNNRHNNKLNSIKIQQSTEFKNPRISGVYFKFVHQIRQNADLLLT